MTCSCIQGLSCGHLGRRSLLGGIAAAPLLATAIPKLAFAADPGSNIAQAAPRNRILIKGGHVVTIDRTLGDIAGGDVLVEGSNIVAAVVLVAQPSHVSGVLGDGKIRKRNGRLVDVDVGRLQKLAQASHDYLIETAKLKSQN